MVAPIVKIDIDQSKRFEKYMKNVRKDVQDLSFSMGEAVRIIKKFSTANFTLKGTGQYQQLDPVYQARKDQVRTGIPILTGVSFGSVSGKMKDSIIGTTPDTVTRIGKLSAETGTKATSRSGAPYPIFVHGGTSKMAARPVIFLTDKMTDRIIDTIDGEITDIWEKG